MKQKVLFTLLISVLAYFTSFSQVTTSRINGTVLDDNGESLFGANVVATHTPSGTVAGSMTLDNGDFNINNLRVGGPYTISVSYVGFKTQEITGVYLSLGKVATFDFKLVADNQLEEVVISYYTGNNTFGNDRTGAETNVGRKELRTLPTISRSASDFTRLEPTASGNSFGGRNDQFNNFSLDGAIFTNPFGLDAATPGGQTDA